MKVIAVDDERLVLSDILTKLKGLDIVEQVDGFDSPFDALEFVKSNFVDIAFLDIEMFGMNGLELSKHIKTISPKTSVVFVTSHASYAVDAFATRASGYLLKPVSVKKLLTELTEIKAVMDNAQPKGKNRIRVQTFGSFEVFCDGVPIKFMRSKTKEMFAYLIDRKGASVSLSEITLILWEDKPYDMKTQGLLRQLILDLTSTLKHANSAGIFIKRKNQMSINTSLFDCDYYDFLTGDSVAVNAFQGEYMSQYAWAEFTIGKIMGQ